jgi:hypothetical protein
MNSAMRSCFEQEAFMAGVEIARKGGVPPDRVLNQCHWQNSLPEASKTRSRAGRLATRAT